MLIQSNYVSMQMIRYKYLIIWLIYSIFIECFLIFYRLFYIKIYFTTFLFKKYCKQLYFWRLFFALFCKKFYKITRVMLTQFLWKQRLINKLSITEWTVQLRRITIVAIVFVHFLDGIFEFDRSDTHLPLWTILKVHVTLHMAGIGFLPVTEPGRMIAHYVRR